MSTISELQVKIGADASGLSSSLNKAKGDIDKAFSVNPVNEMNQAIGNLNTSVSGMIGKFNGLVGLAATGFGLNSVIQSAVDAGDAVYTLAQRLHISAGEAGEFSRILKLTGGDVGTASTAMMRLDKSYSSNSDEGKKCKAVLDSVGVSLVGQNGKLLPINQQLAALAEGYKKANAAGMGQEYVMSTLGVRGLSLITTLERYNEAKASAGKVQGIGLNPEEMHKMALQMKEIEMQAGQLKIAFGSIFVDLFSGQGGEITTTLASMAKLIAENRQQIASTTSEVLKLLAAYEAVKVVAKVGNGITSAFSIANTQNNFAAINAAQEAALTAQQERSIAKRTAMVDAAAKKEEAAYYKTVEAMGVSEAEKTAIFNEYLIKREQASMQSQAAIRTSMTEMYLSEAAAAEESAVIQQAALTKTGETAVAAQTVAAAATEGNTAANVALAEAETVAGNAGATAAARQASGTVVATSRVKTLISAVYALAGGWMGVAAAIAYAGYKLVNYRAQKQAEQESHEYYVGGQKYTEKDGTYYQDSYDYDNTDVDGMPATVQSQVTDADTLDTLNSAWNDRHKNDPDYQAQLVKEDADARQAEIDQQNEELADALKAATAATEKNTKAKEDKTYQVQTAVGTVAGNIAANHPDGEQWMGNITDDPSIQCDSFTANVYNQAGIGSIGGYDTSNNVINDEAFKAANAYHAIGDGYQAQNGDLVNFSGHVGIYQDGNVISRQSTGGVHTASMREAESYFGPVQGYGSIAEATGNMTLTQTVDETGKVIEAAAEKLIKAKDEAYKLFQTMANTVLNENGTTYQQGMNKINQDVAAKQQEINKLAAAGVDMAALQAELNNYKQVLNDKVVKAWHDAWYKVKDDTRKALDDVLDNYEDEARLNYDATVRALDEERKDRLKAISQSENDYEAKLAVDKWYNAQVIKAAKDRDNSLSESHNKMIKQWQDQGDYNKILSNLKNNPEQRKQDLDVEGNKKIASEIVKIWDAAHQSINADIAAASDDLYGSLTTSIEGFLTRTKSAIDVVHDLGNAIMSEIARVAAQKLAGQVVGGLLDNLFGNHSGTVNSSVFSSYLPSTSFSTGGSSSYSFSNPIESMLHPFAAGGIVTAPTAGLIGETGIHEAVIPLTDNNLKSIGGGNGGVVVNITNNSDAKPQVTGQHYDASINKMVLDIVIDGASRNVNGFSGNLKAALR